MKKKRKKKSKSKKSKFLKVNKKKIKNLKKKKKTIKNTKINIKKVKKSKKLFSKVKLDKRDFIFSLVQFQQKIKPKFKFKFDIFIIDKTIQKFFNKIHNNIQNTEKPEFLDAVDKQAAPDLVCLMRKVGIQNLPTETAKRLCISMSPNGINDKELVTELYGDQNIVRNNSEE